MIITLRIPTTLESSVPFANMIIAYTIKETKYKTKAHILFYLWLCWSYSYAFLNMLSKIASSDVVLMFSIDAKSLMNPLISR